MAKRKSTKTNTAPPPNTPKPSFVYVVYINATPERLWASLTDGTYTREYWGGRELESDWQVGSPVVFRKMDGSQDSARAVVVGVDMPWRLVMDWTTWLYASGADPSPPSRVTFAIERAGTENVKLTVTHEDFQPGEVEEGLRQGWPAILSSLKSFLETGQALDVTKRWAEAGR